MGVGSCGSGGGSGCRDGRRESVGGGNGVGVYAEVGDRSAGLQRDGNVHRHAQVFVRGNLVERWALAGLGLEDEADEVFGGIGDEHLVGEGVGVGLDALVSVMEVRVVTGDKGAVRTLS